MQQESQLKEKTAKGLLWGGIGNGALQILNLAFGVFLSRLLSPSDYGVVGALLIFYAVAGIFSESGFILAIVNRKNVGHAEYNAVFWFNVVVSLVLYAGLFASAPLIARFYSQPEMLWLSRFLFLSFVFGAVSAAPVSYFMRHLMVKERSRIQIEAIAASGITGVFCAANGMGYWGLAIQTVLYSGMNCILLWVRCPWRPDFRIAGSGGVLKSMLPFSCKQLVVSLFQQFNNNFFLMLLGRFYGMRMTGFYSQANKWTVMGYATLTGMINGVGQPVLRQTIDDRERTCRVFRKLLRFTCFISFPAMLGLAIIARELIVIAVTDKWIDSVPLMQILCIGGAFMPITTLYGNLFNSVGKPNVYMWSTISLGLLQLLALFVTYRWGLAVMLAVYVAINIMWLPLMQAYARRYIGVTYRGVIADVAPSLLVSVSVMVVTYWVTMSITAPVLSLVARIAMAAGLYALIMWRLRTEEFREVLDFLLKRKK